MDNFNYKKYLAEGRLFEEVNPIWVIDAFEDNADIEQAGPAYKKAVIDIIKSKHPDISDKDLEASIEVMNVTWYNEARSNAKGSEPEEMKVSAEDFADGAIEHYEDIIVFDNNNRDSNIAEGKLLKEDLTITGEYEGEPVVNSGDELEEYLIDIMSQAIGAKDFARKVAFGLTDETSSLSLEDQRKLIQFYLDNKQHFGSQGKSSPLPSSDYDKVVDGLRSRKIPSRVKLEDSGRINIELGFDFPDSLGGKVFDMLDELGVKAEVMAETSARGIESERIFGGPRRDYRREDRDDEGDDEEYYS